MKTIKTVYVYRAFVDVLENIFKNILKIVIFLLHKKSEGYF